MDESPFEEKFAGDEASNNPDLLIKWNFYQSQIEKLQNEKRELMGEVDELNTKLAQEKDDKADIYFYLNQKLDENYNVISTLEGQVRKKNLFCFFTPLVIPLVYFTRTSPQTSIYHLKQTKNRSYPTKMIGGLWTRRMRSRLGDWRRR